MARTTMELAFISAERVQFDNVKLVKLFFGDEPDGEKDLGVSLMSMQVTEEALDEVWAACHAQIREQALVLFAIVFGALVLKKALNL